MDSGSAFRRVPLGSVYVTRAAMEMLEQDEIYHAIERHARGDWGDVDEEDRQANDEALTRNGRLLSSYRATDGQTFWIITEWDRTATTVLLPDDY